MHYAIADGVSFCERGGRFIFLDLNRDRYFALGPEANQAFAHLVGGESLSRFERVLAALIDQGVLRSGSEGSRPAPCRPPAAPVRSLAENHLNAPMANVVWALLRLGGTGFALKRQGLRRVLDRLRLRKTRLGLGDPDEGDMLEIAGAFRRSALIASPLDQCLTRSIAAAHALLDRTCRSELVIGVRLQPFAAHCWLQSGPVLINETLEEARNFTPILAI
jgi:hypothetical protein